MRFTLGVQAETGDHASATDELYDWLRQDPELRGLVRRDLADSAPAGAMGGAWSELLTLLLAPGGPTAAAGAALVVWLQNRRSNVTVTINRPDGTQLVVASEKVRPLTAEGTGELAQRVAEALREPSAQDAEREPSALDTGEREPSGGDGTRQADRDGSRRVDGDGTRRAEGAH
ncbi:hypothetical protein OQI_06345 [Streptomyces pharetrae CZA14]|uniref:Uncharacterized protein n=1 Tax=Streptomyces pharetrae CZA14 TaxID=1144883 RepID=A0ABX3YPZ3_9ACTN|nr:hypothetical protein OQI_06345 [Streptomyces pharetrae CZA14]